MVAISNQLWYNMGTKVEEDNPQPKEVRNDGRRTKGFGRMFGNRKERIRTEHQTGNRYAPSFEQHFGSYQQELNESRAVAVNPPQAFGQGDLRDEKVLKS